MRSPLIHKGEVRIQISKMLEQGIVRLSNSSWSYPVKRLVEVDYRKLNELDVDLRPNILLLDFIKQKLTQKTYR